MLGVCELNLRIDVDCFVCVLEMIIDRRNGILYVFEGDKLY